jgi:hypothetical protein
LEYFNYVKLLDYHTNMGTVAFDRYLNL